jgi:hypothetical protein
MPGGIYNPIGTDLGVRLSNVPLPTGVVIRKNNTFGPGNAAWPGPENYLNFSASVNGELGPINRPERFWWRVGASCIMDPIPATGWIRFDWQLRLLTDAYVYGNDLLGVNWFQKANRIEDHPNPWWGGTIEAAFYCEANLDYWVRFMSKSTTSGNYWQQDIYTNMWSYTVGEGDKDY